MDITPIKLDTISIDSKNHTLGPGIELLMNEKKLPDKNKSSTDINLDDLNTLERELNDLSTPKSNLKTMQSSLFSNKIEDISKSSSVNPKEEPILPSVTINEPIKQTTWDGYNKFKDIPIGDNFKPEPENKMNPTEMLQEKFKCLRKLEALEKRGVHLSKKYTMESSLLEMQGEYMSHVSEKEKSNAVKFQGKMLMAAVTGLEFLNNRFDPFDVKLDGWGEQMNENIDDYDEIFGELHEKYKSKATLAPELKLLFQLGGSAIMVHMTNSMFKSSMPGMDDIMKQNPELMQQFTQAAASHMGESHPQFGNFMNDVMDNHGPPPAVRTHGYNSIPPPSRRPDIGFSRGEMDEGLSINQHSSPADPPMKSSRASRPEMKGPSDISDLLSGLKSKSIELPKDNSSTVSISELKELDNHNLPKRTKRRQKSDKNTVSLDI
jgi:hypothetical protein